VTAMFFLAAVLAGTAGDPAPRAPIVQATATVRILPGARITASEVPETAIVRETRVRGSDGIERNARLVEFP